MGDLREMTCVFNHCIGLSIHFQFCYDGTAASTNSQKVLVFKHGRTKNERLINVIVVLVVNSEIHVVEFY